MYFYLSKKIKILKKNYKKKIFLDGLTYNKIII